MNERSALVNEYDLISRLLTGLVSMNNTFGAQ